MDNIQQQLDSNFLAPKRLEFLKQCQSRNKYSKLRQTENNADRKDFPYLNRLPEELAERPKILLQPFGRTGSLFLHSLIDNHPQIATLPNVIFMDFFYSKNWRILRPDYKQKNWQQILIEKFCDTHKILFENTADCQIPFMNHPGGEDYLINTLGLIPQENSNNNFGYFGVDKQKFIDYLQQYLFDKKYISQAVFFDLLHAAYQYSLNRNINTKFDFYHIHLPEKSALTNFIYLYKNVKLLGIIRNPVQAMESFIKRDLYTNTGYDKLTIYKNALYNILVSINCSFMLFNNIIPSKVIRLEDIKKNTNNTLHKLCEWFGVDYSETLKQETFGNRKFNTPSQQNIKSFNTENIDRKIGSLYADKHQNLSERDYRILNILSYPLSVKYNYQKTDSDFIKSEIKYLKNELSKNENYLFDYEINLQQQLKKEGISEDEIYNIQKNFRCLLLPFLDYLEKYQTYPGLAELLEV